MSGEALKIFTVCLTAAKKFKAYAVFDGERLVITNVAPISGLFSSWKAPLIAEIEDKTAQGFVVVVEEMGESIAQYATRFLLEGMNDENRSNYYEALDWYFQLQDMDCLTIHPDCQQHSLRVGGEGQKIEKKQDDKGRVFYDIDWKWFTGAHRALLLCVVAAMYEPLSERFLHAMWGKPDEYVEENPALRWKKLLDDMTLERGKELERARGATD